MVAAEERTQLGANFGQAAAGKYVDVGLTSQRSIHKSLEKQVMKTY